MSSAMLRQRLVLLWLIALSVFAFGAFSHAADEPAAEQKETAEASAKESKDEFAVPEGTLQELMEFIVEVDKKPVPRTDVNAWQTFLKQTSQAKLEAADKILAMQPDEKARVAALNAKLDAYGRLTMIGQKDALEALTKLSEELKGDADQGIAAKAQSTLLQLRARNLQLGNWADADTLLADTTKYLEANKDDMTAARTAFGIAQTLEQSPHGNALALQAFETFGKLLGASSNPAIVSMAQKFDGVIRRLKLPGNSMEITGTLLDGSSFDLAKYKGKVVLVDFWATWCGPCVMELPNLLENYMKFHDKGFEVVGISLDNSREALEEFMKTREIPWEVIFEDTPEGRGWNNSLAQKYGIMGIPTVILIGADGKVVSLNARGPKLGQLLTEHLGSVESDDPAKRSDEPAGSDS